MRKKHATFEWLQKLGITGLSPADRSRLYKCGSLPDLKGKEILALAMRAHGFGQKAIGRAIGVDHAAYRGFLGRLGLPLAQSDETQAEKRLEKIKQAEERARLKRIERREHSRHKPPGFIGPVMPYYWRNREKVLATLKTKKPHLRRYHEKIKKSPELLLVARTRTRIYNALRLNHCMKSGRTSELLGCDGSTLRRHLESLWQPGMSWSNYGQWHVDHLKPLAMFDLSQKDQQLLAFNYKNLQPLWAMDNWKKNSRCENGLLLRRSKSDLRLQGQYLARGVGF
jgi:hypothetical protein